MQQDIPNYLVFKYFADGVIYSVAKDKVKTTLLFYREYYSLDKRINVILLPTQIHSSRKIILEDYFAVTESRIPNLHERVVPTHLLVNNLYLTNANCYKINGLLQLILVKKH